MFDTMRFPKSRLAVFLLIVVAVTNSLPVSFAGSVNLVPATGSAGAAPPEPPVAPLVMQSAPTYNLLLQDDSTGSMLRWNSTTGEYLYSRCSDGFILTGTGIVSSHGSTYTLTHNPTDRRVQATLDNAQHGGTATIQYPLGSTTQTITDRSTTPDPGASDAAPPQVIVTAPNGGELIDADTNFTITWNATDDGGISKQDVLLSTDGGTSFSPIVTGLAGTVNQYNWFALATVNNRNLRVRVVAYDNACNAARDDSDASFQIVNSGALPHVAESPIFMSSGGFRSIIHLCIHAASPVTVELAVRNRYGTALAAPPARFTMAPDIPRAIDVVTLLTPGAPPPVGDPNISMGSIRLRHNGTEDNNVLGAVAVDRNHEGTSFIVPLTYAATTQSPASTMQCSPLFYIDEATSALLSLQNVTNAPVTIGGALHYGTGAPGTPGGIISLPLFTLAAQQTLITDLSTYAGQMQGAEWGSITLNAPGQTVIAQTVMISHANELAFTSPFIDPAMYTGTTRVASTLKLDYNMAMKACLMVCNTSPTDTRTVTATFKTDNGVLLPSQQVTLGPGQQNMIELDSRSLLAAGTSTMANVTLSYSGAASDIVAGAVSMAPAYGCAIPAQVVEVLPGTGRQPLSPFFYFDERTSGILQISNTGASDIKAGAKMEFSDSTLPSLNTDLITVPAHGTATVDLQSYFSRVDDTVKAQGCLELIHNGTPGTVAATFSAIGAGNNLSFVVPLVSGPVFASQDMELFPNNVELLPGEGSSFAVITGGSLSAPNWSVSSNVGKPGSITAGASTDTYVYPASYVSSADPNTVAVTLTADATASGGPIQTGTITLAKVKVIGFATNNAQGQATNGRLKPDANGSNGTRFTITGKNAWPDGVLTVKFRIEGEDTGTVNVTKDPLNPKVLTGTAPGSTTIGDAQIIVLQNNIKISKDKSGAAYYATDPPTAVTSVQAINAAGTPDGFNRLGGILNINGNGFQSFGTILPSVNIGGLDFDINTINATQINGLVLRAPRDVQSCGGPPCLNVRVKNPGGKNQDKVASAIPIYNLKPGPVPLPQGRSGDHGLSIGGTTVIIFGASGDAHFDFVDQVTVGGTPALITTRSASMITIVTPPHTAGQNNAIVLFDVDNAAPAGTPVPNGGFRYDLTPVTALPVPYLNIYIVGPGEGIAYDTVNGVKIPNTLNCLSNVSGVAVVAVPPPVIVPFDVAAARDNGGTFTCTGCAGTHEGDITYKLLNTAAMNNESLKKLVTSHVKISYGGIGSCTGPF